VIVSNSIGNVTLFRCW